MRYVGRYAFEWETNKAVANVQKHKVAFERATGVFRDSNAISIPDEEHSDAEERWVTIGIDQAGSVMVVVHTFVPLTVGIDLLSLVSLWLRVRRIFGTSSGDIMPILRFVHSTTVSERINNSTMQRRRRH